MLFRSVHHFFTFPVFYIEGINYDYLEPFADFFRRPTKICVSIFAFLTGWSYFYNKNKTIKYSFIKITLLLINFWIICIPFLITAILLGVYKANSVNITLVLLGLNHEVMIFSWYVYFYVISMIMLPFIYKLLDKNIFIAFIPGCILPMIVLQFICKIYADNSYINEVSYNVSLL